MEQRNDPGRKREPVEGQDNECYLLMYPQSHQDLCSTILNVLKCLKALVGDPDEKCRSLEETKASVKERVGQYF